MFLLWSIFKCVFNFFWICEMVCFICFLFVMKCVVGKIVICFVLLIILLVNVFILWIWLILFLKNLICSVCLFCEVGNILIILLWIWKCFCWKLILFCLNWILIKFFSNLLWFIFIFICNEIICWLYFCGFFKLKI